MTDDQHGAGELVMLIGPSGAGKTTWWRGRFFAEQVLSLDDLRIRLTGNIADFSRDESAALIRAITLAARMECAQTTVIDATNTKLEYREPLWQQAIANRRPTVAVVFHTPLAACLERQLDKARTLRYRNQPNGRSTPDDILTTQWRDIAAIWDRLHLEADCVVHVPPHGGQPVRVGDIPRPAGVRTPWLEEMPIATSAHNLPWRSPYAQ